MKTTITARQMNVPADFAAMAEKKLAKFDRFFGDDSDALVKLSRQRDDERVELTIRAGSTIFRAEESEATFQTALDRTMDAIERQIRKHKTKLEKRLRDGSLNAFDTAEPEEEEIIIRRKQFPIEPMSPEEAVMQMNLIGHDFYLFCDPETDELNVVYRRRDGAYGLIQPK